MRMDEGNSKDKRDAPKPKSIVAKVYRLISGYGRKKLAGVFAVILLLGLLQVIGVTSIFPFLALATDPDKFRQSSLGKTILSHLPDMNDFELLMAAGCLAITSLIVVNAALLVGDVVRTRYTQGLAHWLRLRLMRRMISNPYSYFLERNSGELLKKTAGDVTAMIGGVLYPALEAASRLITIIMLVGVLLWIDPIIAISAAVSLGGFYFVVFRVLRRRREQHSARLKLANRGAMKEAQQLLGGIKPIRIHDRESSFTERFAKHSRTQANLAKWVPLYQNTPRYLVEPFAFGGMVAVVLVLSAQGESIQSLLPKLGIIALASYRILPSIQMLYSNFSGISLNQHTVEEVYDEFCDVLSSDVRSPFPPQQRPSPLQWNHRIRFENVTFAYEGMKQPLFRDLSLPIPKNHFVAFVGETGSGKSTLVDLLLGLHTPQDGRILIDDVVLTESNLPNWRASLGYVPQDIFLLDDTIAANIAFGYGAHQIDYARLHRVAETAQIAAFIEKELPRQYQTRVGERGVRLSGGQRQRIGLARALYHQPTTLILDEATSALDNTTEAALMDAIAELQGKMTLIVIAHRLTTIERADRVFVLEKGRIVQNSALVG